MQILTPGTTVGQYEIASNPMMGGMGVVYFSLDHKNNQQPIALKTFRPEYLSNQSDRQSFLREGSTWLELGYHQNIVHCYKVDYIEPVAYLALELISKEVRMQDASLRSWLGRPINIQQSLLFALQIARGMRHASEKISGFVHRDLKPENILVGADKLSGTNTNRLRVTDFGLTKIVSGGIFESSFRQKLGVNQNHNQSSSISGTPAYMAREQAIIGAPIGSYTDIYAFGCILFEMVSGEMAAQGKTQEDKLKSHCHGILDLVSKKFPRTLMSLLTGCLELNSQNRIQTWNELIKIIEQTYSFNYGIIPSEEIVSDDNEKESFDEHLRKSLSYNSIGSAYLDLGNYKDAAICFTKSLSIARMIQARQVESNTLLCLSGIYGHYDESEKASICLETAMQIAYELNDERGKINWLQYMGESLLNYGEYDQALKCFEKCLAFYRDTGNQDEESGVLNDMGAIFGILGDSKQVFEKCTQALSIAQKTGNKRREGNALGTIGIGYANMHKEQIAIDYFKKQLSISSEIANRNQECKTLINLGQAYEYLNDNRQAILYFEKAMNLAIELGDQQGVMTISESLADLFLKVNDSERAKKYIQASRNYSFGSGDNDAVLDILNVLDDSCSNLDKHGAIACCEKKIAIAKSINMEEQECSFLFDIGNLKWDLGEYDIAIAYFQKALNLSLQINYPQLSGPISYILALIFKEFGDFSKAMPMIEKAIASFTIINNSDAMLKAQDLYREIKENLSEDADNFEIHAALQAFQKAISLQDMRDIVRINPALRNIELISAIEKYINEEIDPKWVPAFRQRFSWLKIIISS